MSSSAAYTGAQISDQVRDSISAMLASGYSHMHISRKLAVARGTVAAQDKRAGPPTLKEAIKKGMGDKFAQTADNALEAITPKKLLDSSAAQLSIIAATAVDKMLLLDGKPTQIHAVALFEKVQDNQNELHEELANLKSAMAVPFKEL